MRKDCLELFLFELLYESLYYDAFYVFKTLNNCLELFLLLFFKINHWRVVVLGAGSSTPNTAGAGAGSPHRHCRRPCQPLFGKRW
jgi:hypothetical protein